MKILYIGSSGALSLLPLLRLLESRHTIEAVAVDAVLANAFDARSHRLIAAHNETVEMLATQQGIAVIDLAAPEAESAERIHALQADIVLVSCYGRKIAPAVLKATLFGAFNLHPSLLPAYRGPMPVFWQLRDGLGQLGVTIHLMDGHYDHGDIAVQTAVTIRPGEPYAAITRQLAQAGTGLMLQFLEDIERNRVVFTPQDASVASYQPYPDEDAFEISLQWPARRIYSFVGGTRALGHGYTCTFEGRRFRIDDVLDWRPGHAGETLIGEVSAVLPCSDGQVVFSLAAPPG